MLDCIHGQVWNGCKFMFITRIYNLFFRLMSVRLSLRTSQVEHLELLYMSSMICCSCQNWIIKSRLDALRQLTICEKSIRLVLLKLLCLVIWFEKPNGMHFCVNRNKARSNISIWRGSHSSSFGISYSLFTKLLSLSILRVDVDGYYHECMCVYHSIESPHLFRFPC